MAENRRFLCLRGFPPSSSWFPLCCCVLLLIFLNVNATQGYGTSSNKDEDRCKFCCMHSKIAKSAYATAETILRGFTLGFGTRMLKFSLIDNDEDLDKLRDHLIKAVVTGISLSSFILGMSMFLPERYRALWFQSGMY